jgi:uncharacterized Fe-S center protein
MYRVELFAFLAQVVARCFCKLFSRIPVFPDSGLHTLKKTHK